MNNNNDDENSERRNRDSSSFGKFKHFRKNKAIKHYISNSLSLMKILCLMIRHGIFKNHGIPYVIPKYNPHEKQPPFLLNKPRAGVNPLINPNDVEYDNEQVDEDEDEEERIGGVGGEVQEDDYDDDINE